MDTFSFTNNYQQSPLLSIFDKMVQKDTQEKNHKYSKNHNSTKHWVPNDESEAFKSATMKNVERSLIEDPFLSPLYASGRNRIKFETIRENGS